MPIIGSSAVQDTTVVTLARDSLTLVPAWAGALIALVFVVILVVLLLVLVELRRVSSEWVSFLSTTGERSRPLVEHASAAASNLEHITQVVRKDVDRVNEAFLGLADGIGDASGELQKRLKDLMALLDLAQSEAEDTVLEAAAKLRSIRAGMDILRWPLSRSGQSEGASQPPPAEEPALAGENSEEGSTQGLPAQK